jgi:hypothetical protein
MVHRRCKGMTRTGRIGPCSSQPQYNAAQAGGQPCVSFNGAQYMRIAAPGALKAAIDGCNSTAMIACRVTGTPSLGVLAAVFVAGISALP